MKDLDGLPVDRVAARVIRKGVSYTAKLRDDQIRQARDLPSEKQERCVGLGGGMTCDLTGVSFGRVTVVSYVGRKQCKTKKHGGKDSRGKASQVWQCRCQCGNFLNLTAKSIEKRLQTAMCAECERLEILRKRSLKSAGLRKSVA